MTLLLGNNPFVTHTPLLVECSQRCHGQQLLHNFLITLNTKHNKPAKETSDLPMSRVLLSWHRLLGLSLQRPPWYKARLREELAERRAAQTALQRLSETCDVFYILGRARHDGYPLRRAPPFNYRHPPVYAYMISKYTLRWIFYQIAALICGSSRFRQVREVVNPARDSKLREVASRHDIEAVKFERVCRCLRRVWPLLP